jgi:hypothetical protein
MTRMHSDLIGHVVERVFVVVPGYELAITTGCVAPVKLHGVLVQECWHGHAAGFAQACLFEI